MTKKSNPAVFFGSGPVAARALKMLVEHQHIAAIVTKPSTKDLMASIVQDIPVYAVANKSELDDFIENPPFQTHFGILIDFGIIVSQKVIDYFERGIINSHFSLLPELRGADPITFALLSGQKTTGVSLMVVAAGLDEGPIISQAEHDIEPGCTSKQLTEELILLSDTLLRECIEPFINEDILPVTQESAAAILGREFKPSYSRKLTKEDGRIDWVKPANLIEREIRAYHDWPKSFTKLNGIDLIIREAVVAIDTQGIPGKYEATKKSLVVFCGENALEIKRVQPSGKKEMPIEAFLAGYRL